MDLFSDEMRRNPYPMYEQMRAAAPVLQVPQLNVWMIFDYAGVKQAVNDHDAFRNSLTHAGRKDLPWFIFSDPPQHTKLRGLINKAFTPRVVANLEPRIAALSRQLLDKLMDRGEMDVAMEFGGVLPMLVIAELLGIPTEDRPCFQRWSDAILNLSYDISPTSAEAAEGIRQYSAATAEMNDYLTGVLAARAASQRDDLLTRLAQAEVDGERLTQPEILGFFQLLLVAGQETTSNLINNAILCLIENPDQLARLRAKPDLLPLAIEETLRYRAPLQWVIRATCRDVPMHRQMIPAGSIVLPVIGSANRDRRQFEHADRFDITRDPNPHIAFGHGIHSCLGAPLARLEAKIALTDFLGRVKSFTLASNEPWEPRKALHVHGPARLPIRLERV
jgi:cytochrome P450